MQRRMSLHGLKTLGVIAALAFFFMPLNSLAKFLLCFVSLAAAVVCYAVATKLEDERSASRLRGSDKAQASRFRS